MTAASENPDLVVGVEPDRRSATLTISAECDADSLTRDRVLEALRENDIVITPEIETRVDELIAAFRSDPKQISEIIATATLPVHGTDGSLEFHDPFAPERISQKARESECGTRVDHYEQREFVHVTAGTHIATLHPPTDGQDGTDVTGQAITARNGKPCEITIDASLGPDENGRLIAREDGVLEYTGTRIRVTRILEVSGHVDFSTGNIDFQGSISIRDGVRDRFAVKASEDVFVGGLVEAARITCGRDFAAKQGIAAKDRGQLTVARDAEVGYLNNVRGRVGRNLLVRREIINCELIVGGDLEAEKATLIGGVVIVTGRGVIGTLGSRAGVPTTVILGDVPLLRLKIKRLEKYVEGLNEKIRELEEHIRGRIRTGAPPEQDATIREWNEEIKAARARIEQCDQRHKELLGQFRPMVDLSIRNIVYCRTCFRVGGDHFVVPQAIKGPLRITWDEEQRLICREGDGAARPLTDVARPMDRAA